LYERPAVLASAGHSSVLRRIAARVVSAVSAASPLVLSAWRELLSSHENAPIRCAFPEPSTDPIHPALSRSLSVCLSASGGVGLEKEDERQRE